MTGMAGWSLAGLAGGVLIILGAVTIFGRAGASAIVGAVRCRVRYRRRSEPET